MSDSGKMFTLKLNQFSERIQNGDAYLFLKREDVAYIVSDTKIIGEINYGCDNRRYVTESGCVIGLKNSDVSFRVNEPIDECQRWWRGIEDGKAE